MQPCAASEWNHRHLHRQHIRPLWLHMPHLLQQSPLLGQGMHSRAVEPDWTWTSGLLLQQLRSRPYPWQDSDNHRAERKLRLSLARLQILQHQSHPLSRGQWPAHPEGRRGCLPYQNYLAEETLDTVYTGIYIYIYVCVCVCVYIYIYIYMYI